MNPKHEAKIKQKVERPGSSDMGKEKHILSEEMLHHLMWLQSNKKSKTYQSQDLAIALFFNLTLFRELLRIKAYIMGSVF